VILVADDDRTFNHLVCRGLRQAGYSVTSAFDAFQASTMILRGQFEAVILDIQMPAGTGLEVLKRLKNSCRCMETVVIVVSATCDESMRKQVTDLGAEEYLAKPFDVSKLVGMLRARSSN
jgi:DNA-binding response OmpR family regulator